MYPYFSFINSEAFYFSDSCSGSISNVVPGSNKNDAVSNSVGTFLVIAVFDVVVLIEVLQPVTVVAVNKYKYIVVVVDSVTIMLATAIALLVRFVDSTDKDFHRMHQSVA